MASPTEEIRRQPLYNPNNKLIKKADLEKIFSKTGVNIAITNLPLWQLAFTNSSYCVNRKKLKGVVEDDGDLDITTVVQIQDDCNERLEWLGDSILQSDVGEYLWIRFPNQSEGFLTTTRSKLVKREMLYRFAQHLDFGEYLLISKYVEDSGNGRNNPRILEDAFEAFFGVLYLETREEFGHQKTMSFIKYLIESVVDMPSLIMCDDNYKKQLMEYYQKTFNGKFPKYYEVSVEGPPNLRSFTMCVHNVDGEPIGHGTSKSKKEAEQLAAKNACIRLGIIKA